MPTWPSGTKAGTTNVDNPNDLVANARADIKQNIDNVNDIIDTFNIATPSDGDLLQYSSSSGQWEQVASSSVGSAANFATIKFAGTDTINLVSGNIYRKPITELFDPNNIVDTPFEDSTGLQSDTFTLPAGNYIFTSEVKRTYDTQATISIFNESDSTEIEDSFASYLEVGNTNSGIIEGIHGFTLAGTKTLSLRQNAANSNDRNVVLKVIITKF